MYKYYPVPHKDAVHTPLRALVVFSGQTELKWLRLLKPGFRHCFVLIENSLGLSSGMGEGWVLYNPLSNATQLSVWPAYDVNTIRAWLVGQGYVVIETYVRTVAMRALPWRPFTCVEAVKRALGLYTYGVFTPWQLYRHLNTENKRKDSLTLPLC